MHDKSSSVLGLQSYFHVSDVQDHTAISALSTMESYYFSLWNHRAAALHHCMPYSVFLLVSCLHLPSLSLFLIIYVFFSFSPEEECCVAWQVGFPDKQISSTVQDHSKVSQQEVKKSGTLILQYHLVSPLRLKIDQQTATTWRTLLILLVVSLSQTNTSCPHPLSCLHTLPLLPLTSIPEQTIFHSYDQTWWISRLFLLTAFLLPGLKSSQGGLLECSILWVSSCRVSVSSLICSAGCLVGVSWRAARWSE